MALIKRKWTAAEADSWTKEDYFAMILSVISYIGIAIGTPLAFFGWHGWLILGIGIAAMLLMIYIIDPKLKALSEEYEKNQKKYLEQLQRMVKWEE